MRDVLPTSTQDAASSGAIFGSLGMNDDGLVLGAGSVLVRMSGGAPPCLALEKDRDRLLALLSVAHGRPVAAADVLHHIEAAARHWQRGDKALANLRLVVASLPRLADQAAVMRLSQAAQVLDGGMAPGTLMKALWPEPPRAALGKYNPDQPRVPAGNGIESGRWEFGGASASANSSSQPDGRVTVAMEDDPDKEGDVPHLRHEHTGRPEVDLGPTHLPLTDPLTGLPGGATQRPDLSIEVSLSRFGEAAQHMSEAQISGQPSLLTINRTGAASNRTAATGKVPKVPNMHLDEYPPAMFREGGLNASVRAVNPNHNQALGAYIGRRCLSLPDGSTVELKVVP